MEGYIYDKMKKVFYLPEDNSLRVFVKGNEKWIHFTDVCGEIIELPIRNIKVSLI